jgi:hypothetical protein
MKYTSTLFAFVFLVVTSFAGEARVWEIFYVPGLPSSAQKTPWQKDIPDISEGPVWDIREFVIGMGVTLAPDDIILWAPSTHRIFTKTSQNTLNFIEALITPTKSDYTWIDILFFISEDSQAKPKSTPFRFQCRSMSGQKTDISLTPGNSSTEYVKVQAEPVLGPDGHTLDLTLSFDAKTTTWHAVVKGEFTLSDGVETVIWESDNRSSSVRYRCTIKPTVSIQRYSARMQNGEDKDRLIELLDDKFK